MTASLWADEAGVVSAGSCDDAGEHPTCCNIQQDWGTPIRLRPGAPAELCLGLRGA